MQQTTQPKEAAPVARLSPAEEVRLLEERDLDFLREHRTWRGQLPVFGASFGSAALFLFGPLAKAADVPQGPAAAYFLALPLAFGLSTTMFQRSQRSERRLTSSFLCAHALEMLVVSCGALALVHASGSVRSVFWVFHFAFILSNVVIDLSRLHRPLFIAGPCGLALVYMIVDQDMDSGATALLIGGIGLALYEVTRVGFRRVARSEVHRVFAERELRTLAVLREKERLARDLHDGLGAELASMVWRARALERKTDDRALAAEFGAFSDRIHEGLREMRNIVWAVDADDVTLDSLERELRVRCLDVVGDRMACRFDERAVERAVPLSHTLAVDILRVAQEGVRNAVRHARGATHITIRLTDDAAAGRLTLEVEDDGAPTDASVTERSSPSSDPAPPIQRGLENMRRRAAQHGGGVLLESNPSGTRLAATFMLAKPA